VQFCLMISMLMELSKAWPFRRDSDWVMVGTFMMALRAALRPLMSTIQTSQISLNSNCEVSLNTCVDRGLFKWMLTMAM
jgi:hypothetical protein